MRAACTTDVVDCFDRRRVVRRVLRCCGRLVYLSGWDLGLVGREAERKRWRGEPRPSFFLCWGAVGFVGVVWCGVVPRMRVMAWSFICASCFARWLRRACVRGRVGRWPWVAVGMHVWSTCLWHCLLARVGGRVCATDVRDANGSRLRGQDDDGHEKDGLQRR